MPFRWNLHWLLVVLNANKREIQVLNLATFSSDSDDNLQMITEIKILVSILKN
jgi:hypothetical protein